MASVYDIILFYNTYTIQGYANYYAACFGKTCCGCRILCKLVNFKASVVRISGVGVTFACQLTCFRVSGFNWGFGDLEHAFQDERLSM